MCYGHLRPRFKWNYQLRLLSLLLYVYICLCVWCDAICYVVVVPSVLFLLCVVDVLRLCDMFYFMFECFKKEEEETTLRWNNNWWVHMSIQSVRCFRCMPQQGWWEGITLNIPIIVPPFTAFPTLRWCIEFQLKLDCSLFHSFPHLWIAPPFPGWHSDNYVPCPSSAWRRCHGDATSMSLLWMHLWLSSSATIHALEWLFLHQRWQPLLRPVMPVFRHHLRLFSHHRQALLKLATCALGFVPWNACMQHDPIHIDHVCPYHRHCRDWVGTTQRCGWSMCFYVMHWDTFQRWLMTFIAQAPEGCQMWLHEMFQFDMIKQTWEEKRFGRKVDGPWTLNGEGSMDLLVSQVSNRTLIRRVVKKESERSFPFSMHSDMSVSEVIFDLFEKKGTAKNVSEQCERESLDRWIMCLYVHICTIYMSLRQWSLKEW